MAEFPLQTEIYRMPKNRKQTSTCQSLCRRPSSGTRYAFFVKPAFLITLTALRLQRATYIYKNVLVTSGILCVRSFQTLMSIRRVLFREKINSLQLGARTNRTRCKLDPVYNVYSFQQGGHIPAKIKFPVFSLSFPCVQ